MSDTSDTSPKTQSTRPRVQLGPNHRDYGWTRPERVCEWCSALYVPNTNRQRFCGMVCFRRWCEAQRRVKTSRGRGVMAAIVTRSVRRATSETCGQRIARLRLSRGWTQESLGFEAGVTQTTVWRAEQSYDVHVSTFAAIAVALDASMDYLWFGEEDGS